jgi:hypothetical protein
LTANDVCVGSTHSTSTTATSTPGQVIGFTVTVDPDGTVVIEPIPQPPPEPAYDFFFLEPITAEGHQIDANTSVFKAGSTVPVKFELIDDSGNVVQAGNPVEWIDPVKGPALNALVTESVFTSQPTSGSEYEWNGSHYQFNWKTSKAQGGFWYYLFVNVDGNIHQTIIGLR